MLNLNFLSFLKSRDILFLQRMIIILRFSIYEFELFGTSQILYSIRTSLLFEDRNKGRFHQQLACSKRCVYRVFFLHNYYHLYYVFNIVVWLPNQNLYPCHPCGRANQYYYKFRIFTFRENPRDSGSDTL